MKNVVKTRKCFFFCFSSLHITIFVTLFFFSGFCAFVCEKQTIPENWKCCYVDRDEIRLEWDAKRFLSYSRSDYAYSHIERETQDMIRGRWVKLPRSKEKGANDREREREGKKNTKNDCWRDTGIGRAENEEQKKSDGKGLKRNSIKSLNFVYFCFSPLSLPLLEISSTTDENYKRRIGLENEMAKHNRKCGQRENKI